MTNRVRRRRFLAAAAAVVMLAGVAGCGPSSAESAPPAAAVVVPAATSLAVHAADASLSFGSGVEVSFALSASGTALPATATASVKLGERVVRKKVTIAGDGTGSVDLDAAELLPGAHVVTVSYAGDTTLAPSAGRVTVTVGPAASRVALTLTPLPTGATTAAAAVTTMTGVPADGAVVFTVDGTPVGEAMVADGAAEVEIPAGLPIGDHAVTAAFTPAVVRQVTGADTTAALTVSKTATAVLVTAGDGSVRYGDHSTFAIAVTPNGPPADLTGAVTVTAAGATVAQGSTDATGTAALEFYNTADPGTQNYSVSYAGNDRVEAATAEVAVTSTTTSVDIAIDKPSLKAGESGTVTVSVVGSPQTPSGTATVTYDGDVIAEGALDGDGDITAKLDAVVPGSHTIAVSYSGDTRFDPSDATTTLKVKEPLVNPNADGAAAVNADNPCPASAEACVDLAHEKAWLQSGGQVTYGPVSITSGRPGFRTPAGTYSTYWFDKDHKSSLYEDAPMPNSVFFNGDIAFHQGSLSQQSHGCIHLSSSASSTFFNTLSVGDTVYVWGYAPY